MKKIVSILLAMFLLIPSISVFAEEEKEEEEVSIYDIAEANVFTYEDTVLPYRYVLPEDYSPEKQYPLILFLHAELELGNDNASQLRHCVDYIRIKQPQSIIVAPQCNHGNQWVDVPLEGGNYSVSDVPESNELKAVMALLDKVKEDLSVDADRVSVVGVSIGGYGAWDLLIRHTDEFAAGVIMCGGGDPSQAELLKDMPLYVFHGAEDEVVPPTVAREMVQSIIDTGGTKVRYFEIVKSNHEVCYELYFTSGVIESLSKNKISDRDKEEEPEVKVKKGNQVKDAGLKEKPSRIQKIVFLWMPAIVAGIVVVIVLKKVKF